MVQVDPDSPAGRHLQAPQAWFRGPMDTPPPTPPAGAFDWLKGVPDVDD